MPVTKKKETYSEAMARLEKIVSQDRQQRAGDRCACRKDKGGERNYSILQR